MQNSNSKHIPGTSATVPKKHNLGQTHFQGGAPFPGCLFSHQQTFSGETHPPTSQTQRICIQAASILFHRLPRTDPLQV